MPSTATISAYYVFVPYTSIRSSEVNSNFDLFRGHLIPIDPNTTTAAATSTYDLGSSEYRWRYLYGKANRSFVSTTGSMTIAHTHDLVFMDSTSATITGTLPAVASATGSCLSVKNIGTAGKTVLLDGNGAETIDGTITVNIVDYECLDLFCDGTKWQIV